MAGCIGRRVPANTRSRSSGVTRRSPLLGRQRDGALEEQRVHERLREIAAQLALVYVVFLGEDSRRATRGAIAFEERNRCIGPTGLVEREREPEAANQEGAFALAERRIID